MKAKCCLLCVCPCWDGFLCVGRQWVGERQGVRVRAPPGCSYMLSVCFHLLPPALPAFCSLSPRIRTQVIKLEVMGHLSFSPLAPAMGSCGHKGALESHVLMGPILVLPAGLSVWSLYTRQTVRQTRLPLTLCLMVSQWHH